jgi:Icc-related predicted phosphoesterase
MSESKPTYFAAANSYHGFVSYFDRVFPSESFAKIFVLKGGPGTGKSSLMRKLSHYLSDKKYEVEEILCSSDPTSLDGVIANNNGVRIAIIDGTAPHERDAIIPGAIDEIINLGDNWDERWLVGKRAEILSLVKEKKKAYQTAYNYLNAAGKCADIIDSTQEPHFNKFGAKCKAEGILSDIMAEESGDISTRLLSSFGRYGKYNLKSSESVYDAKITVSSDAYLFLKTCAKTLMNRRVDITLFPSALDPKKLDAILLNSSRLLIHTGNDADINGEDFLSISTIDKERIRVASEMKDEMLYEGARWFKIAAEIHSSLEDIYSSAMDFTKNDEIYSKIVSKIALISEKGQ